MNREAACEAHTFLAQIIASEAWFSSWKLHHGFLIQLGFLIDELPAAMMATFSVEKSMSILMFIPLNSMCLFPSGF